MMQNAKRSQPEANVLDGVTLIALQNNIHLRYGYLHHEVEEAFGRWLDAEGYAAFLAWLKEKKT